jgi:Flp pilus assembly protein TadG
LRNTRCGQGIVEFILISSAVLLLLFGALQMALILNAVLSVNQLSYAGARYASIHAGMQSADVASYMTSTLAPRTIDESGGADITVSLLNAPGGSTLSAVPAKGNPVTVQVTYDLKAGNKIVLPASFLPVSFSTHYSNSSSMMVE